MTRAQKATLGHQAIGEMATPRDAGEATAFVDALYRKVLLAVKASNGVPSEDDDYHYHAKFSAAFAAQAHATGTRVQELIRRLGKSGGSGKDAGSDGEDEEDNDRELFEGPEPKARITDLVDALLDDASRQLEIVARGGAAAQSQLENKPMVFDKKQTAKNKKQEADAARKDEIVQDARASSRASNKPQDKFDERIDNSSAPFASKLREKVHALSDAVGDGDEEEGPRHPYYPEIRGLKYADWQVKASTDPYEKIDIENASYLWVDTEEKLQKMMESLLNPESKVVAVDLEHHSYRSYLGLVCLMQISTAREDFLVDPLALRGKLQVLNEVFCDPTKVKVLHGADMDILWLQRDLGLYIVNMFDTGQAARLLNYPRYSLAYLLKRHCAIDADKQYQLADWRIRPLDRNMVKYAREDTRYLLYIYDQLKQELIAASEKSRSSLLLEALQNSSKICLQVYEKPEVTEHDCESLREKLKDTVGIPVMSELQKRVFHRLFFWRDAVARAEDESHAYVLPNHVMIKIAKNIPLRSDQLFRTCNPVPALVRKRAHEITTMISSEKAKAATEATSLESEKSDVSMSVQLTPQKRRFTEEDNDAAHLSSVKDLAQYPSWKSGFRKARETAVESDAAAIESSLRRSFPEVVVTDCKLKGGEEDTADALRRVNDAVANNSFVVAEVVLEQAVPVHIPPEKKANPTTDSEAVPTSLAEEYQLSNRAKRRKTEATVTPRAPSAQAIAEVRSSAELSKQRAEGFIQQVEQDAASPAEPNGPKVKAFDYAAASKQVAGAQLNIASSMAAKAAEAKRNQPKGGKLNKKAVGGRGYNPFVAVRGGKSDALEEPAGAKAPVKKIHQMPRSSTFR